MRQDRVLVALGLAILLLSLAPTLAWAGNPIAFNADFGHSAKVGTGIQVTWTTSDELQTAGYNLYRGEQPEGPFQKLNAYLIPASTDVIAGGRYTFDDTTVEAGKTYYYQLELVTLNGKSQAQRPVVATLAAPANKDSNRSTAETETGTMVVLAGTVLAALGSVARWFVH